jgi:hypothetical protein
MSSGVDHSEAKGRPNADTILEIANGFQACTELRTINRALRAFSLDLLDGCQLDVDSQRELDTLIDWLEHTENSLDWVLGEITIHLGLKRIDLPEASHKLISRL